MVFPEFHLFEKCLFTAVYASLNVAVDLSHLEIKSPRHENVIAKLTGHLKVEFDLKAPRKCEMSQHAASSAFRFTSTVVKFNGIDFWKSLHS